MIILTDTIYEIKNEILKENTTVKLKKSNNTTTTVGILLFLWIYIFSSSASELGEKDILPDPHSTSDTSIEESLWNRQISQIIFQPVVDMGSDQSTTLGCSRN